MKAGWTIKMPAQVPPAVSNQFTAMIPSGVILTGSMLIYAAFNAFAHTDFLNWIYNTLQIPLQGISDSFGGAIAIGFITIGKPKRNGSLMLKIPGTNSNLPIDFN